MCDVEKVKKGTDVDDVYMTLDNIYAIRQQCLQYGFKYVKLVLPDNFNVEKFKPAAVYKNGDELPSGIYTYLFYTPTDVIAVPVNNQFEIGTGHHALAYLSKTMTVFAAGEMQVDGKQISFNLLSGSYMRSWMTNTLKSKCDAELTSKTKEMLEGAYPGYTVTYTQTALIRNDTVPITKTELNKYTSLGIEVRLYNDKAVCRALPELIEQQRDRLIAINQRFPAKTDKERKEYEQQLQTFQADLDKLKDYEVYKPSGGGSRWKMPRKYTRRYCKKTPCRKMGFTQRSSCRPYKNCFRKVK